MYNEERKTQYLNTLTIAKDIADTKTVFNKIEAIETKMQIDISDCNYEQTVQVCSEIGYTVFYTRSRWLAVLSDYVDYEIKNGYSQNEVNFVYYYKINSEDNYNTDDDIIQKYLKDPCDAYNAFCNLLGEPIPNSKHISYFAFLCLAYCGFSNQEILDLQRKDIDFNNYTIKEKIIYPEFWDAIINSLKTQRKIGSGASEYQLPSWLDNYIIKNDVKNFCIYLTQLLNKLKKENIAISMSISIRTVRKSGDWYRLYIQEQNQQGEFVVPSTKKRDYMNYKKAFWG